MRADPSGAKYPARTGFSPLSPRSGAGEWAGAQRGISELEFGDGEWGVTVGQLRASIDVPAGVQAPGTARRLVSGLLPAWGMAELADDAAVVVSELVTNAWLHAQDADSFELELAQLDDGVQISLADGTAVLPVIRELDQAASAGRGMRIVIALAEAWGAEQHHGGKRVWVRLSR